MWVSNKDGCRDGEKLFEALVPSIEDSIKSVKFQFTYSTYSTLEIDHKEFHKYFANSDRERFMRCYTSKFPKTLTKKGIGGIIFQTRRSIRIIIHSFGMFFGTPVFALKDFSVHLGQKRYYQVDRDVFQALDIDGESCNKSLAYDRGACINDQLSIEERKFGCNAPFGPNKTFVCDKPQVAKKLEMVHRAFQRKYNGTKCPKPCNYLKLKVMQTDQADHNGSEAVTKLLFEDRVKTIKSYYLYSFLSLIAEIGGYVGLFLGVSVYQLTTVFDTIISRLKF